MVILNLLPQETKNKQGLGSLLKSSWRGQIYARKLLETSLSITETQIHPLILNSNSSVTFSLMRTLSQTLFLEQVKKPKPASLKFTGSDTHNHGTRKQWVNSMQNNGLFSIVQSIVVLLTHGCIFLVLSIGVGIKKAAGA